MFQQKKNLSSFESKGTQQSDIQHNSDSGYAECHYDCRQADFKLNDSRQNDCKLNDSRQNDSRQNDSRQNDSRQNDSRPN